MAFIAILIEDNEEILGQVTLKVEGDYSGDMTMLKNAELTPTQMLALFIVDAAVAVHKKAKESGGSFRQYMVDDVYKSFFEDKAV